MNTDHSIFKENLAQTTPFPFGIRVERAEGSYIFDKDGKAYLDLISGIAVSSLGHGNEKIKAAIKKQLDKHLHVMVYGEFEQDAQNDLARELLKTLPENLNSFYFVNSGTEANEAALKLAKRLSGRTEFIAFKGSYHGSTHGSLSISYNEVKKSPFRPLLPGVKFIELNKEDQLDQVTNKTAAVILETIQGDAGVRIPNKKYLKALRQKCDQTGTLLILDEIQCGVGRTGKYWAFEHFDILPDILTAGKALGAGMPIGCLITNKKMMSALATNPMLGHITTFGGHPLACAAAAAGLEVINDENVIDTVESKGQLFEDLLKHKEIKDFRRIGLMIAIELTDEKKVEQIVLKGVEKGIILFWFLSTPNAFRLAPPLTISEKDVKKGCKILLELLNEL